MRRGSTLVRTVRTLRRRTKGRGSDAASPAAPPAPMGEGGVAAAGQGEATVAKEGPPLQSALSAPASITPGKGSTSLGPMLSACLLCWPRWLQSPKLLLHSVH